VPSNAAILSHVVCKERTEDFFNTILSAELQTLLKLYPRALVLSVSALHLLVFADQDLFLQDLCPLSLLYAGYFQDLCGIQPAVIATTHDCDAIDFHFIHIYSGIDGL
jgi:hypothetical protein